MFRRKQVDRSANPVRKFALRVSRSEAKELDSYLQRLLPPVSGYSSALLGRALAEFSLRSLEMKGRFFGPIMLLGFLPILLFAFTWLGGAGWDEFGFLITTYYLEFLLVFWIMRGWQLLLTSGDRRRIPRPGSYQGVRKVESPPELKGREAIVATLAVAGWTVFFAYLLEPGELVPAFIKATGAVVWAMMLMLFWELSLRHMLAKAAPQAVLVRSLATACGLLKVASPAQWRNVKYRRRAAAQISAAAALIEGPTLRILANIPVPGRALEWRQVRDTAAGLRRLAGRMVTRGMDARPEIEQAVAMALVAAVDGSLVNPDNASASEDEAAIPSRLGIAMRAGRNMFLALLPAIGVAAIILGGDRYGWEWAQEARPLLIQFAIVSVIIGLMSALDPSGYHQRLSAITGAGGSLFARR